MADATPAPSIPIPARPVAAYPMRPPVAPRPAPSQYQGYYNQRYYNYQYGIHTEQKSIPQQFSQVAENEEKQRPIYLAIAGVAIIFGLFMIFSAFAQPKITPEFRAELEKAGTADVRAIIVCENCSPQLEALGATIIANYPEQGAVLISASASRVISISEESYVKAVHKP